MKLFITGATGNVGLEVLTQIDTKNNEVIAGVRNPDKILNKIAGVDYRRFDFLDEQSYPTVLENTDAVFFVRPPAISNVKRDLSPFIAALQQFGVKRIVFLSLLGVQNNSVVPHYQIEKFLKQTSIPCSFLRAGFFMQNLTTTHLHDIRDKSLIYLPAGKGKTSFVDVRDIATIACNEIVAMDDRSRGIDITGSEALSYYQVADILSEELRRKIVYKPASIPGFFRYLKSEGNPISYILVVTALYTITRLGRAGRIASETQDYLGRSPKTMREFVRDNQQLFQTG